MKICEEEREEEIISIKSGDVVQCKCSKEYYLVFRPNNGDYTTMRLVNLKSGQLYRYRRVWDNPKHFIKVDNVCLTIIK